MMKKLSLRILLAVLCLKGGAAATAQVPAINVKFGNPTQEEMTMQSYDPAPDASAVVLCSYRNTYYKVGTDGLQIVYDVKTRLKILKPDGADQANISVTYVDDGHVGSGPEAVTNIKATAYNLVDGKVVKMKMRDDLINRERLDKHTSRLKFTVPQVKEGTVVEYQYRLSSYFFYNLRDWYAQDEIPTRYAYYELTIPEYFKFSIEPSGQEPMTDKRTPVDITLTIPGNTLRCSGTQYVFTAEKLPALKDDQFVWHATDFSNRVTSELRTIYIPGTTYKDFSQTWADVDKTLMGDDSFGARLKQSVKDNALTVTRGETVEQTVADAVKRLNAQLSWDGTYGLYGDSFSNILKKGSGSNADLNFILMAMLREAGVDCVPLVMRRRDTGRLPITHPTIDYLNTMMVGIVKNDTTLLVYDASAKDGFLNTIPPNLLSERVRVVAGRGSWLNLQQMAMGRQVGAVNATLAADGSLSGEASFIYYGETAQGKRRAFREAKDSAEYVSRWATSDGISIDSHQMSGHHDFSNEVREHITFTKTVDATDDHIYMNPVIFLPVRESPFKAEERKLPVEFPFRQTETINVVLRLPDGYEVEELPKNGRYQTPDGGIVFVLRTMPGDNIVSVQCQLNIKKTFFGIADYPILREMMESVAECSQSMLVLKKTTN